MTARPGARWRGATAVRRQTNRYQRSPLLRLTETGQRQLRALNDDSAQDRASRLASARLTAAQLDQARQVLRSLIDALDD